MSDLRDLFPAEDFGFRLTLRRSQPAAFFAATAEGPALRAERTRWLRHSPQDYAILTDPAQESWREFVDLASTWQAEPLAGGPVEVGQQLEPDVVLLDQDEQGTFRVSGGVVVFPSHWALADKIGRTLREVHGVVPGLNAAMGPAIDRYLHGIKPGLAMGRPNWGLAATDARNLHPSVPGPPLRAGMAATAMWLRVEHQLLTALPQARALLFGIRIERRRLDTVLADPEIRRRFHRAIITMPAAVAAYKGLTDVIATLARLSED